MIYKKITQTQEERDKEGYTTKQAYRRRKYLLGIKIFDDINRLNVTKEMTKKTGF